jgi:hypothetical protein
VQTYDPLGASAGPAGTLRRIAGTFPVAPTFGARLQALWPGRCYTQATLARAASRPVGTLRDYEQDKRDPRWSNVVRLVRTLGVTVEDFLPPIPEKGRKGK